MKNLIMGFILGVVLVFSIGAVRNSGYQNTLCNRTDTPYFLYTVLNQQTGETRIMLLNTTPRTVGAPVNDPPLILKMGTIDINGKGEWYYAYK